MEESILTSIKKLLGITEDYTQFDVDIIMHINSVFMILHQVGVGPEDGLMIEDKTYLWEDFLEDPTQFQMVKSYTYMKVRLLFDPPTGGALESMKQLISEFEWRLNIEAES